LETLPLRVRQQTNNAGRLADYLADHPAVAKVIYPGRADHPQAEVCARQMKRADQLLWRSNSRVAKALLCHAERA
jgi:O-succinylhomoserine sulfhydrylase